MHLSLVVGVFLHFRMKLSCMPPRVHGHLHCNTVSNGPIPLTPLVKSHPLFVVSEIFNVWHECLRLVSFFPSTNLDLKLLSMCKLASVAYVDPFCFNAEIFFKPYRVNQFLD